MERKGLIIGLLVLFLFSAGCVTVQRQNRAIGAGARGGAVGAAIGALVGVAANTHVGRAAALGALALGVPAMALDMATSADQAEASRIKEPTRPTPPPLHLPGPKEIFISGSLRPEIKWVVVRELRNLGYQVSARSTAPLHLRVKIRVIGDPKCIALVYLVDRPSGRILAQGRGEVRIDWVTAERLVAAQKRAVIAAIRNMR